MATWGELSNFTWDELADMELTWGEIESLSFEQLLERAERYLPRFKSLPDDIVLSSDVVAKVEAIYQMMSRFSADGVPQKPEKWNKRLLEILVEAVISFCIAHVISHGAELLEALRGVVTLLLDVLLGK